MEKIKSNKEITVVRQQVEKAQTAASNLTIKTSEDMTVATDLLSKIKQVGKLIKNEKEKITVPANEALKAARNFFAPFEKQVSDAEAEIKKKMIDYQVKNEKKIAEQQEKVAAKAESGKMDMDKALDKIGALEEKKQNTVSGEGGGKAQFRTIKKVVIENPELLPREYLIPDEVKIRKAALAGMEIAGVKVVEEKTIAGL
jgi:phenylalanyl-tRNA synthetase alpha subunit